LPPSTEDELILAKFHSKLDRVLQFLTREIGYALLDDARPARGGGVHLPRQQAGGGVAPPSQGRRSVRRPIFEPEEAEGQEATAEFFAQGDREKAREVIKFSAESAKYAQFPDDLVLVWRFTATLIEATSEGSPETPNEEQQCTHDEIHRTVLQGVRLMHLCHYDYSDLVLTLAYASVYFQSTCQVIGHRMSGQEAAHVVVLLIFLAHTFVIDETCPLRYWQKFVFRKYCTLKVLDQALFRIFQMRDFRLRISDEDERQALSVLLSSPAGFDVILSAPEDQTGPDRVEDACNHGCAASGSGASEAETWSTAATSNHL